MLQAHFCQFRRLSSQDSAGHDCTYTFTHVTVGDFTVRKLGNITVLHTSLMAQKSMSIFWQLCDRFAYYLCTQAHTRTTHTHTRSLSLSHALCTLIHIKFKTKSRDIPFRKNRTVFSNRQKTGPKNKDIYRLIFQCPKFYCIFTSCTVAISPTADR